MGADKTGENVNAHVKDYSLFLSVMKWGTILSLITAAIVVLIIAN